MAKIITANGNAQIDTAQSKFGGASGLFDGTGDFLSTFDSVDFNYGSGDFTIDFWYRPNSLGNHSLYCHGDGTSANLINLFFWNTAGGRLALNVYTTGSVPVVDFYVPAAFSAGTWYHIELVRNGSNWYIFINGTAGTKTLSAGSYSNALPNISGELRIGAQDNNSTYLNGWLDEYRISKGIARHTSNFTAPTAPYVADANTQLLLHMDGTDASTSFVDNSWSTLANKLTNYYNLDGNSNDFVSALNGTDTSVTYNASYGKLGQGARFNGSSSKIINATTINLSRDLARSFWVKTTQTGATYPVLVGFIDGSGGVCVNVTMEASTGKAGLFIRDSASNSLSLTTASKVINDGSWHHIVLVKQGNLINLYVDNVLEITSSATNFTGNFNSTKLSIGSFNGASDWFNGDLDEISIYNDGLTIAEVSTLYNSSNALNGIATATAAYYKLDNNSIDSIGFSNGVDTAITYSSGNGKINEGAGMNGSTSHITSDSSQLAFVSNMTVSCWIKPAALPTSGNLMSLVARFTNDTGKYGWDLRLRNESGVQKINWNITNSGGGDGIASVNQTLSLGTWYHILATNDGVNSYLYINGTQVATVPSVNPGLATNNMYIGAIDYNAGVQRFFDGAIDEVAIIKGALNTTQISQIYNAGAGIQYPYQASTFQAGNFLMVM